MGHQHNHSHNGSDHTHHDHAHHDHGLHDHHHSLKQDSRSLIIAMVSTGFIFVVQLVGSFISHSLALLSDSGHMLIDLASLFIAFIGLRLALRRSQADRFSYGWRRVEILAALLNGTILLLVCGFIFYEVIERFRFPQHVMSTEMLVVAIIGSIANAVSLYFLHGSEHLTTKSAYLHVLTDLLSSVGVVIGALLIYFTGWDMLDPIISLIITVLIARSAVMLIKRAVIILMESTPEHLNLEEIRSTISAHGGVLSVHDVHVWQIGAQTHAVSAHIVVEQDAAHDDVLASVQSTLHDRYGLHHSTLQLESQHFSEEHECRGCDDEPLPNQSPTHAE